MYLAGERLGEADGTTGRRPGFEERSKGGDDLKGRILRLAQGPLTPTARAVAVDAGLRDFEVVCAFSQGEPAEIARGA